VVHPVPPHSPDQLSPSLLQSPGGARVRDFHRYTLFPILPLDINIVTRPHWEALEVGWFHSFLSFVDGLACQTHIFESFDVPAWVSRTHRDPDRLQNSLVPAVSIPESVDPSFRRGSMSATGVFEMN
jgi:hypothetical protein